MRGKGAFESETRSKLDFKPHLKGERFEVRRHKNSDLLKGEGPFMADTNHKLEYGEKRGDRFAMKTP